MFPGTSSGVKVSSEIETLKTNEFLRRRKLRLQQVREQSKDIAKQIRQRANVEKLRHIVDLDSRKEREYLERQEKIVKQLEDLYSKSVQNVGASHKSASDLNKAEEEIQPVINLSKIRGREAAFLLHQEKQKKLDAQKKVLDRKLQAREVANELFREKSKNVTNQLKTKPESTKKTVEENKTDTGNQKPPETKDNNVEEINPEQVNKKIDMGTQWNFDELPNEWEPAIPKLSLPTDKDGRESIDQSEKSKHLDLFALSEDMPSSLRGGPNKVVHPTTETAPSKPSLTLVSEYLHQRSLRLREPDVPTKKPEDLKSIKQTIQRTRAARTEGNEVCNVHDGEVIPMPSWQASSYHNQSPKHFESNVVRNSKRSSHYCSNSCLNHTPRALQPGVSNRMDSSATIGRHELNSSMIRGASSYRRTLSPWKATTKPTSDKNTSTKASELALNKKPSVKIYNHSTRDTRDIIHKDQSTVTRNSPDEDAYAQAFKKNSETVLDKEHERKLQEMRSKIAMTKQSVEKEYNDTLSFLNSLPKEKPRPVKQAFMNEMRQQQLHESRQRKLQQEFNNIERECRRKSPASRSRSPANKDQESSEFQYSWMPVPEGDASLAVHSIPTAGARGAAGRAGAAGAGAAGRGERGKQVKFGREDSYHEYRSRHKHTPPTKEKPVEKSPRTPNSSYVDTLVADISNTSTESESEDQPKRSVQEDMSDAERIIIYKIVESKNRKRSKTTTVHVHQEDRNVEEAAKSREPNITAELLKEGIYKTVNERGDHISSLQVTEPKANECETGKTCACGRPTSDALQGPAVQWECGDAAPQKPNTLQETCQCERPLAQNNPLSTSASSCSFRTAAPAAAPAAAPSLAPAPALAPILVPDGKDAGNFYIGASGFLKDEDYEVIIQLRKKDVKEKPVIKEPVEESKVNGSSTGVSESQSNGKESKSKTKERLEESDDQIVPPVATQTEAEAVINVSLEKESRKAMSAFTQTTLSSPITRPEFLHMSSSTSTAYMSPPDVLVPKILEEEVKKYRKNTPCTCRKCRHATKVTVASPNNVSTEYRTSRCTRHKKDKKIASKEKHKRTTSPPKEKSCKCRKCMPKPKGSKSTKSSKKSNQTAFFQLVNRTRCDQKANSLNPTVKEYINKLLALNKEGLNAIVSNQECSSVATPGSSVVDADHNASHAQQIENKISLEQINTMIKQQIAADRNNEVKTIANTENTVDVNFRKRMQRVGKSKKVHKVKSLNISKNIIKSRKTSSMKDDKSVREEVQKDVQKEVVFERRSSSNSRSKSSPTPRSRRSSETRTNSCDTSSVYNPATDTRRTSKHDHASTRRHEKKYHRTPSDKVTPTFESILCYLTSKNKIPHPKSVSSRMEETIDDDINLMKIAKSKYRNMEKIADMTKKCSQRISHLTEKLDEVRKSKSSGVSQICSSSSSEGHKSDKSISDIRSDSEDISNKVSLQIGSSASERSLVFSLVPEVVSNQETNFVPLLEGIRKPESSMTITPVGSENNMNLSSDLIVKLRNRPPTALSRVNLKHGQENLTPHELSTVIEVDSPISLKLRSQTTSNEKSIAAEQSSKSSEPKKLPVSPRKQTSETRTKHSDFPKSHESQNRSKSSKAKMMDLQKFNDIMMKPFFSVEEFAKQCKVSNSEEISQVEETIKTSAVNEEMSSLHSDGSLPDVVAELLRRKVIDKPFTFDTPSVHSTTASSETSLSVFNPSKVEKKKSTLMQNKENIAESSDTLSFSSNPDLEKAFKQMGMGWASSTLKKTKERLALSSSSNTSATSQNHRPKYSEKSNTSGLSGSILKLMMSSASRPRKEADTSRNVEQQTSLTKSMTMKEYLTKELANRITFSKAEHESDEFVSLYETKMPDEMKNRSIREDRSIDDSNTNRARTSTPVQLYKSATYKSSSSSNNMSNGLFSNVDELSSVKVTSSSMRNHSTSDKDDLTIPSCSLRLRRNHSSVSKSD